jgi:predicted membrane metal-binding protein
MINPAARDGKTSTVKLDELRLVLVDFYQERLFSELALTPIGLYHFHKAGLYGTFANIVTIPLTTFVIMPAEALALLLDLVHLGAPFWWIAGKALHLLLVIGFQPERRLEERYFDALVDFGGIAATDKGTLWLDEAKVGAHIVRDFNPENVVTITQPATVPLNFIAHSCMRNSGVACNSLPGLIC